MIGGAGAQGAGHGLEESALRALAKLDQVLPASLRDEVEALNAAVVAVDGTTVPVEAGLLSSVARACRDHVLMDFAYLARDGSASSRRVEPYRVVAMGRRWYLLAYDLDRDDWRSFRLDRIRADSLHLSTLGSHRVRRRTRRPTSRTRCSVLHTGMWRG